MILKLNETNKQTEIKHCQNIARKCIRQRRRRRRTHNYTRIRIYATCACGRYQAGENIHNDDKREELQEKRRAGLDLNVSGTREIAAPTRITVLSPSMATRWTRSIDGTEANEVKIWRMSAGRRACWVWEKEEKK